VVEGGVEGEVCKIVGALGGSNGEEWVAKIGVIVESMKKKVKKKDVILGIPFILYNFVERMVMGGGGEILKLWEATERGNTNRKSVGFF
jgi:hypothetical protein